MSCLLSRQVGRALLQKTPSSRTPERHSVGRNQEAPGSRKRQRAGGPFQGKRQGGGWIRKLKSEGGRQIKGHTSVGELSMTAETGTGRPKKDRGQDGRRGPKKSAKVV